MTVTYEQLSEALREANAANDIADRREIEVQEQLETIAALQQQLRNAEEVMTELVYDRDEALTDSEAASEAYAKLAREYYGETTSFM